MAFWTHPNKLKTYDSLVIPTRMRTTQNPMTQPATNGHFTEGHLSLSAACWLSTSNSSSSAPNHPPQRPSGPSDWTAIGETPRKRARQWLLPRWQLWCHCYCFWRERYDLVPFQRHGLAMAWSPNCRAWAANRGPLWAYPTCSTLHCLGRRQRATFGELCPKFVFSVWPRTNFHTIFHNFMWCRWRPTVFWSTSLCSSHYKNRSSMPSWHFVSANAAIGIPCRCATMRFVTCPLEDASNKLRYHSEWTWNDMNGLILHAVAHILYPIFQHFQYHRHENQIVEEADITLPQLWTIHLQRHS